MAGRHAVTVTQTDVPEAQRGAGSRPLRLAFVAVSYTAQRDGVSVYAENVLLELLAAAARFGLRLSVDVYVCGEAAGALKDVVHRCREDGGDRVGPRIIATPKATFGARYVQVPRLMRRNGPYDAIFVPNLQPLLLPRAPTVGVLHDATYRVASRHFPRWRVWYMDLLTRLRLRLDDAVGSISETTTADLRRLYPMGTQRRCLQLPNGLPRKLVDHPRPSVAEAVSKLRADHLELIFVGRINRLKGFDRVREACVLLDEHCKAWGMEATVHVVGKDTPETPELLAALGLERVRLLRHGYLTDPQLNDLYRRSAYCLFLSRNEGFGLPLLEAVWQRCVPLLSDIAIFREVMGDGYPLFRGDSESLAALVDFVARLHADPRFCRQTLERMDAALHRWEGGYRRAAESLLRWVMEQTSQPGRTTGVMP
ncbi:MAG: glycosyltransferase [Ectothiorhodospiraceae bacterium]|jgi:glycosyltransferase involved in cell wall biosynthesis